MQNRVIFRKDYFGFERTLTAELAQLLQSTDRGRRWEERRRPTQEGETRAKASVHALCTRGPSRFIQRTVRDVRTSGPSPRSRSRRVLKNPCKSQASGRTRCSIHPLISNLRVGNTYAGNCLLPCLCNTWYSGSPKKQSGSSPGGSSTEDRVRRGVAKVTRNGRGTANSKSRRGTMLQGRVALLSHLGPAMLQDGNGCV